MSGVLHAPATTAGLTAAMETGAPHLRPVLQAVRDCGVGFLFATQGSGPFAIPAKPKRAAAIVILGDDMEQSTGPAGFHLPSVRRAIRSCAGFAVVSSAPGFTVSHESSSGDSWGELRGPFATGAEAIADAAKLNGYYGGDCIVAVCDAAAIHANPGVGLPSVLGDI